MKIAKAQVGFIQYVVLPQFETMLEIMPELKFYKDGILSNLERYKAKQAEEEKLLKLWEGLGYYNRVRNMQKAATVIMDVYQGSIPSEYEELCKLPGIGSYTAGAIASITVSGDGGAFAFQGSVLAVMLIAAVVLNAISVPLSMRFYAKRQG